MNSAIHLPGDLGARIGVAVCTTPEILRARNARLTLRMTGLAGRVHEATST